MDPPRRSLRPGGAGPALASRLATDDGGAGSHQRDHGAPSRDDLPQGGRRERRAGQGARLSSTRRSVLPPNWPRLPDPDQLSSRARRLIRIVANLVGAGGAALFARATLQADLHTHRLIGTAFFVEQVWVVVAYLVRRPTRTVSRRWGDWLLAFGGTFGGVLFRPDGAHPSWGLNAGLGLQLVGLAMCLSSFVALGRSFGFAAADRGLVRRGPYAVVRHPIYASYFLLQLGYVLQSISLWNALVLVFVSSCNVGRAMAEERLLSASDQYEAYRNDTRWRLVPGIW
jgi:protein-S-isoprenylcysteine O-methyltransferase Ste14